MIKNRSSSSRQLLKIMKPRWSVAWAAVVLLITAFTVADEEVMDDSIYRLEASEYVNEWNRAAVDSRPVGPFNRAALEHWPDPEDVRKTKFFFESIRPLTYEMQSDNRDVAAAADAFDYFQQQQQLAEQQDQQEAGDEADRAAVSVYVEQENIYPDSYQGYNGHSYQARPPVSDPLERLVDSLPIDPSSVTRKGDDYKVVCYYESWAIYREEPMTTSPADVDPFGCTHVIYSFLGLDKTSLTVTILDPDYEVIRGGFKAALALKQINPNLKVMIAIGGWTEGGKQYSQMVSSAASRAKFIDSVVAFMEKWGFDGFDLDWEYPGATDRDGRWSDKENFALLVEEMSVVFKQRNWLLTAAVPAAVFRINEGYDVPRLARGLDFINVMTYDLHGTWDNYADHHAPLFKRPVDTGATQNLHCDGALSYWISKGAPASKIIFGIPFYGRNFRLANPSNTKLRAPISGAGTVGPYTKEAGFVAYFEICDWLQQGGWQELKDEAGSPYLVKGDQWIGYDNVESITNKMDYIKSRGLGGAMIWAVGLDDIRGTCGPKRPLLQAINDGLGRNDEPSAIVPTQPAPTQPPVTAAPAATKPPATAAPITRPPTQAPAPTAAATQPPTEAPEEPEFPEAPSSGGPFSPNCLQRGDGFWAHPEDCTQFYRCVGATPYFFNCPAGLYFNPSIFVCDWPSNVQCRAIKSVAGLAATAVRPRLSKANNDQKIICYYSSWAWLRRGKAEFVPENVAQSSCTHVLYAYAGLDPKTLLIKSNDIWTDISNRMYSRLTNLKLINPEMKFMLVMGGWTDSGDNSYSRLVSDSRARSIFATHAAGFVKTLGFDGLHLDWQYPVCWQADCSRGPATDRANYPLLLQDLKREFAKHDLLLGVNVASYKNVATKAFDGAALARSADFITVPTYDYHGSWERVTGHTAPLRGSGESDSVEASMNYWMRQGIPLSKLIVGIPFYGQTFTLAAPASSREQAAIGAKAQGAGLPGPYTQQAGMLAYYEVCEQVRKGTWTEVANEAPYAFKGTQWVGYDNVESVRRKAEYIAREGFGGAMVFSIDMDDFRNTCCNEPFPLTRAIARVLGLRQDNQPRPGSDCKLPPPPATPPPLAITTGFDSGSTSRPTTPSWTTAPTTTTRRPTTTTTTATTWWWTPTQAVTQPPTTPTRPRPTRPRPTTTTAPPAWWTPTQPQTRPTTRPPTRPPTVSSTWWWTPSQPTTTAPTTQQTTTAPAASSCVTGQYYPVPGDCGAFARCVGGKLKKNKCSPGLHWNAAETLCDWPEKAKCDVGGQVEITTVSTPTRSTTPFFPTAGTTPRPTIAITQRPTTTKRPVVTTPSRPPPTAAVVEEGPCREGEYSQRGPDCSTYQWCVNGQLIEQGCQPGLHWNQQIKVCDWPANAKCPFSGQTPVAPTQPPRPQSTTRPSRPTTTPRPTTPPKPSTSRPQPTTRPPTPIGTVTPPKPVQPGTSTAKPIAPSKPGQYKVICYYTNWSWYRPGEGKYAPSDVDLDLCTHILFGFATLDPNQLTMRVFDSWSDTDEYGPKLYSKVVALKSAGIKVLIALGGWNDSLGNKYSRMVNDPAARKRFIDNALVFIEKYGFDGLDLDWEYPKCWQVDCNAGPASDKPAFAALVRELREAFTPRGLLLSSAVSPSKAVIDAGYDVPSLSRDFDWIGVMTYDYHGHWDKKTGHVAPFGLHSEADVAYFNTNYTLNYWIQLGADPAKLILGVPLYGQSFTLENPRNNGLNAPAKGTGTAGEFTRQGGFLAYYEICKQINNGGWTVVQDEEGAMGPYAYKGDQWVSFDDAAIIRRKSELVRTMKLGGAMIWALDLDDFRNRCGCEKYPLLKTINRVLRNYPASTASCANNPMSYSTNDNMVDNADSSESVSVWAPILAKGIRCSNGVFQSHDSDCSKYYQCVNGEWKENQCPGGLKWNRGHCDWSFNTNCVDRD